jgi:hypothetical protein
MNDSRLGNSTACSCDVIVLSYKQLCTTNSSISNNVRYITKTKSTWASGRNELFFAALQMNKDYQYYIFLDDDVKLRFAASASKELMFQSPFRVFEQWLVDFEPVVGIPHYPSNEEKALPLRYRKDNGCDFNDSYRTVLSTVHFDPLFNAFHRKALHHLLPYSQNNDFECWWTSNRYVSASAEIKFRGQAVLYLVTEVDNTENRPYPRGCLNQKEENMTRQHIIALRDETPIEFHNHSFFKYFIEKPFSYIHDSDTYCINPTAKMDIVPYRHFLDT